MTYSICTVLQTGNKIMINLPQTMGIEESEDKTVIVYKDQITVAVTEKLSEIIANSFKFE